MNKEKNIIKYDSNQLYPYGRIKNAGRKYNRVNNSFQVVGYR